MAKYGKDSQNKIAEVMKKWEKGELKSGKSEKPVTSQKQAVAIGISEARKAGDKVPPKKK